MRPITAAVGPLAAASATNIRTALNGAAGPLVLDGVLVVGGVAILDVPRQVLFTTGASETGHTILLTGTSRSGQTISETITLPGSATTVGSVLSYKTVTSAVLSADSNSTISIGTSTIATSAGVRFDDWAPGQVAIQVTASGTVNWTLQSSLDDPNDPTNPVTPANMTWVNTSDTAAVGATGTVQTNFQFAPKWARILLNSGTGTVTATFLQAGTPPL